MSQHLEAVITGAMAGILPLLGIIAWQLARIATALETWPHRKE